MSRRKGTFSDNHKLDNDSNKHRGRVSGDGEGAGGRGEAGRWWG